MFKIDNSTANPVEPLRTADGPNPGGSFDSTLETIVTDEWLNALQNEISGVVESAGLTLDKSDDTQLQVALDLLGLEPAQFRVRQSSTPGMQVVIAAGKIQNATTLTKVAAQTTAAFVAPTTNPRIDRIVIDSLTGSYSVITGTEAASPVAPIITIGKIAVAQILLQTSTAKITDVMITDERGLTTNISDGNKVLLASATANNTSSILFIDALAIPFHEYRVDFYNVNPVNLGDTLVFNLSDDSGVTWAGNNTILTLSSSQIVEGNVQIFGASESRASVYMHRTFITAATDSVESGGETAGGLLVADSLRIKMLNNNINTGTFFLYGINKI